MKKELEIKSSLSPSRLEALKHFQNAEEINPEQYLLLTQELDQEKTKIETTKDLLSKTLQILGGSPNITAFQGDGNEKLAEQMLLVRSIF